AIAIVARPERHDAIGMRERERAKQRGVHEREHGVVHANTERQRDDRGERDPAVLDEHPGAEPKILPEPHAVLACGPLCAASSARLAKKPAVRRWPGATRA